MSKIQACGYRFGITPDGQYETEAAALNAATRSVSWLR